MMPGQPFPVPGPGKPLQRFGQDLLLLPEPGLIPGRGPPERRLTFQQKTQGQQVSPADGTSLDDLPFQHDDQTTALPLEGSILLVEQGMKLCPAAGFFGKRGQSRPG